MSKQIEDSTIYLVEILPSGSVGRLFTAFVNADSIKNAVERGDRLDLAVEIAEQSACEIAIRNLNPPLADRAEARIVTEEYFRAF